VGFPLGKVLNIGGGVLSAIVRAVPIIQAMNQKGPQQTGREKKATVLELVQAELAAAELLVGHDLANDADVLEAAGVVTDAVVLFHKVLARKAASPSGA